MNDIKYKMVNNFTIQKQYNDYYYENNNDYDEQKIYIIIFFIIFTFNFMYVLLCIFNFKILHKDIIKLNLSKKIVVNKLK